MFTSNGKKVKKKSGAIMKKRRDEKEKSLQGDNPIKTFSLIEDTKVVKILNGAIPLF